MTADRLTRDELTWLLTQEARTAALKLRQGVGIQGAVEIDAPQPVVVEETSGGVEGQLNKLDEAVSMLASLYGHPQARGRRGKIDLAALVWEVAPEARVQLEMGEGTTVFGDEAELRRMLHVLLGQSGDLQSSKGTPGVTIRREGDEVRVGVHLGPDAPMTFESERVWLSRMAIRYGGRLELDGATRTLVLAADVDTHRRELERLKKELAAAQAQGEAYARELAAMFTRTETGTLVPVTIPAGPVSRPSILPGSSGDGLVVLAAALRTIGADMRGIFAAIGRDIAPLRDRGGETGDLAASVGRHITGASEIITDMARVGACPIGELPRLTDLGELLREIVRVEKARANRHDVEVELVGADIEAEETLAQGAIAVLVHTLLDHAIDASPAGSKVSVTLTDEASAYAITFDDAGPSLPPSARSGVLSRDFEALALGRPRGLSLIAAYAIAANLRTTLELGEAPKGGTRVRLVIPRSG